MILGIATGFRISFNYHSVTLVSAHSNMRSATDHPTIVTEYLTREKEAGCIGTLPTTEQARTPRQISPFGVIPKTSKPGKWRLIIDLSSPDGHSVNDGIDKALCSISYVKIDQVVRAMLRLPPRGSHGKNRCETRLSQCASPLRWQTPTGDAMG